MQFTTSDGTLIPSLTDYVSEWLSENRDHEVYIGTDSKQKHSTTKYVSVVVLYKRGLGGHVLIAQESLPKITVLANRLWHEVVLTHQLATEVLDGVKGLNPINVKVHLDINPDPKHASNIVHQAAKGYIQTLQIPNENIFSKPGGFAASFAADHFLRQGREVATKRK